jgi:glycosyltransferase involved in cell wall biosynthesis
MNILQVEPATNWSGGVNQTFILSRALKEKRHKVYIACCPNSPIYRKAVKEKIDTISINDKKIWHSAKIVRNFIRNNHIDVVHTNHSRGHSIGLLASLFLYKHILVVQRSVLFKPGNLLKYLSPRVNAFFVNSYAVKNILKKYFIKDKKIFVIPSVVDGRNFYDLAKEDAKEKFNFQGKIVGCIGNFSFYKGHTFLIEAFAHLSKKYNDISLVIVGQNTKELNECIKKYNITDKVKLMGFREDAIGILKSFDVLVVPSLMESFPNVILEAMMMKVPVVGTSVGGMVEMLSNNRGILIKPKDIGEISSAHNIFLHTLATRGIIGFLAFVLLWYSILKSLLKRIHFSKDNLSYAVNVGVFVAFCALLFAGCLRQTLTILK